WEAYSINLMKRMGIYNQLINNVHIKARQNTKRILFSDADNYKVLKAIQVIRSENIAEPVLLGNREKIEQLAKEYTLSIDGLEIIDCKHDNQQARRDEFANIFYCKRNRKGVTLNEAQEKMYNRNYFGVMMVETGMVDGFLSGFSSKYSDTIRPALQIMGANNSLNHIAGMYIVQTKRGPFFFADTTVNQQPSAKDIANTTILTANEVRKFNMTPVIALVSYSNFGSVREGSPQRAKEAVEILHRDYPDLLVDGEMQANYAFNKELRQSKFPFSKLADQDVNTIIFPNLSSGNIAYKMMNELADAEIIGPILLGIRKPVHILQMESTVRQIIDMAAITAVDAQSAFSASVDL
ncbi:MAG: NADP-dependent malic enzyme, partial [Bacteroidales bacterium]|nr:NADP-dependent malic enzyme [Bacteroidales bacterium]